MTGRRERQREFFTDTPDGDGAVRVSFDTERGQVTDFTVQYEIWRDGRWLPVVRYDSAHGQPHRDTLDRTGRVVDKDWMPRAMTNDAAMQYAIRDIKANWATYLSAFEEERS